MSEPASYSGKWIGASHALGREVRTDEPYPHICKMPLISPKTGQQVFEKVGDTEKVRPVTLWRRDCAACAAEEAGGEPNGKPKRREDR